MGKSCDVIPLVERADGSTVESQLYKDLQNVLPKGEVRNFYSLVASEQFKQHVNYSELEKDENGEPTIQALFDHTPLHKRMSEFTISEKIIHELGMRSVDNLGIQDIKYALAKVMEMNEKLKEAKDGKQFFRVALCRNYAKNSHKMSLEVKVYKVNKYSEFWDYQMEEFAKSLIDISQQIMSYSTIDDLLFKALSTFPMGVNDINTFNPNIMYNLIKTTQENINHSPTPVKTVSIKQGDALYNRCKTMALGIDNEAWETFIYQEKLPINVKEFRDHPEKYKQMLFETLFAKYQMDHAIVDMLLTGESAEYMKEMFERLNKQVTETWKNIQLPEEKAPEYNADDILDTKEEDDPYWIDTEKMIKELGERYEIDKKAEIGAKELLVKVITAEQNQVYIQNRLETKGENVELNKRKNLVKILTAAYENGCYETALFEYYNHIVGRIKDWKELINNYDKSSVEFAKELRQAYLEIEMFHEISDYVRQYKDTIILNKQQINDDIMDAVENYMNIESDEELNTFMTKYKTDPENFKQEYPELVMFAQAYWDIDNLDESKGLGDLDEKIVPMIKDLEDIMHKKMKALVINFLKAYQDKDAEIIPFGKKKGQVMDIERLLTRAQRDMNGFERLLDSLGDSPDMILRLLDKVAKTAKNTARIRAVEYAKEIVAEGKILEQAGITDTKWMFHRDKDGNKTGRYIMTGDPEMAEINADPAKSRFYNFFMNAKELFDGMYPSGVTRSEKIIAINKDLVERLKEAKGIMAMKDEYLESIKDEWMNRNAADEDAVLGFSNGGYTLNGEEINVLPVFYQNVEFGNIKALNSISEDAVSTLVAYAAKAVDYAESNKIINKMELARLVLKQREIPVKKNGLDVVSGICKQLQGEQDLSENKIYYKDDGKSNLSQRLGGFMDVAFYAKSRKDETIGKFSTVKIADKLNAWTARAAMSLSLLNGLSNVATGNMMMTIESLSKAYFDPKDTGWADLTYAENIVPLLGNLGNRVKDDKLSLFIEMFDVLQEYDKDQLRNVQFDKKTKLGRLEFGKALMFMQDAGEHWMASRTALALAHKFMLKDADGQLHNLWDSLEIVYLQEDGMTYGTENKGLGAKLQIKEGYTKEDGSAFTENDLVKFQLKLASINQGMHGIYNKMDSNMIQMTALGRLAYIFRKWVWKSYSKRFEDINYNYNIGEWNEGYYRSTWHFMQMLAKDVKDAKLNIRLHWNELHDTERANIKKCLWELGITMSIMGLNAMVDWDSDDDDFLPANIFFYQCIRLQSELATLTPLALGGELVRLGNKPIPALNTISNMFDTLSALWIPNWFEEVERGKFKGYSKAFKSILNNKVINPYFLTFEKTLNVKDEMKWYMQYQ